MLTELSTYREKRKGMRGKRIPEENVDIIIWMQLVCKPLLDIPESVLTALTTC